MGNRNGKILYSLPIIAVLGLLTVLYILTCPRDLSWAHYSQDSGDLITAAYNLDIPHPTGYPLFTMVGHIFTRLNFGLFSAPPLPWNNPAFKMILFVILTSIANLYLFWRIHCRLQDKLGLAVAGKPIGSVAATIGCMALGTSYLYWSQSIIAEVYILNLFFVDLTLLIILILISDSTHRPKPGGWFALGLAAGLGLFHHLTYGLFLPGFLILTISCLKKPGRREIGALIAGILLSMLPLLYLPIRSIQDPPMDTQNPENWRNFIYLITAVAYRKYAFDYPVREMIHHLYSFNLGEQFGAPGVLLICVGIGAGVLLRNRTSRAFVSFCLISTGFVLFHVTNYNVTDRTVFSLPAFLPMAHLLTLGGTLIFEFLSRQRGRTRNALRNIIIVALIIGAAIWQGAMVRHAFSWGIDVSQNQDAKQFGSKAFANLDKDAIIFAVTDGKSFSLIYHRYILFRGLREDVDIVFVPRIQTPWWWENVATGHPNVKMSIGYTSNRNAIIADIIRTNIDSRPIYTAWPILPLPEGYSIIKTGNIFRIITKEKYENLINFYHRMKDGSAEDRDTGTVPAQ